MKEFRLSLDNNYAQGRFDLPKYTLNVYQRFGENGWGTMEHLVSISGGDFYKESISLDKEAVVDMISKLNWVLGKLKQEVQDED